MPLLCLNPMDGFPWDDLRKIFAESRWMTTVPNSVETLPKISIAWVWCTNVTDDRQADGRWHGEREPSYMQYRYNVGPLHKPRTFRREIHTFILLHARIILTVCQNYKRTWTCSPSVFVAQSYALIVHVCLGVNVRSYQITPCYSDVIEDTEAVATSNVGNFVTKTSRPVVERSMSMSV